MRTYIFRSHGLILGSGIAIECGNSVFNTWRNFEAVFQCGCTIYAPVSNRSEVCPLLSVFLILVDVMWCHTVVLICISLMTSKVQHLFTWLFTILRFSLERRLIKSFVHFLVGAFCCCHWVVRVLYIFWVEVPYQIYDWLVFSPSLWLIFSFSWWCHFKHRCFIFWWSPTHQFFFCCCAFGVLSENSLPNLRSWKFILVCSFKSFIVLTST